MKLPTDYKLTSLSDLRRVVILMGSAQQKQSGVAWNEELEMTVEQYLTYKRLVFEADFIRRFDGMEIVCTPRTP